MSPAFLVPESDIRGNGESSPIALGEQRPAALLVTLGINKAVEQEMLLLGIYGSADGSSWEGAPIASFPQKFYPGVSTLYIDLRKHPDVAFIRAQWKTGRWGRGEQTPTFTFYVFAEPTNG